MFSPRASHKFFKIALHSAISNRRILFLFLSLGRIPNINTFIFSFFLIRDKPISIIHFAISSGRSLPILFTPHITATNLTEGGNFICWHRQRTCCVLSPLIPRFSGFKLESVLQTSWYLKRPLMMESPTKINSDLVVSAFTFCS